MHYPGSSIRLRSSARTSTGKVRENNEDNVHLLSRDQFVLAIVADGMGGAAAGEEASRIAVNTIHEDLAAPDYSDYQKYHAMEEEVLAELIRDAIRSANINIVQKAINSPALKGMGTTLTLAVIRETHVVVAHVGDSRAYSVSKDEGEITQITSDHSFVEALVSAGHITREEAEDHPMKNVLYRALGQSEDVDIDVYYQNLYVGDRMVLCSDGLTRHVKSHEIAEIVLAEDDPEVSSQKLIDLANQRGGEDNISVVVITVERDSSKSIQNEATFSTENDDTLLLKEPPLPQPIIDPPIDEEDTAPNSALNPLKTQSSSQNAVELSAVRDHLKETESEGRDLLTPDQ